MKKLILVLVCSFLLIFPGYSNNYTYNNNTDNIPTEITNILDYNECFRFKSANILELSKFLVFGFGTEYYFRIKIKPYFKLDPYNNKPRASMVIFEFSF